MSPAAAPQQNKSLPALVYLLSLAQFAAPVMFSGIGVVLPEMGRELRASGVQLGLIEIIYLGASSAFLLPVGYFADLSDKKFVYKLGSFSYAFCTLTIGFLSYVPAIIGMRFLQGASGALVMATNMAILSEIVPAQKLGRAIGVNVGAIYFGLSAGPFLAGWITNAFGWRAVFFSAFVLLILSFILIHFSLKSNWKFPQIRFDWAGTVLIVSSVFLLISGSAVMGRSYWGFILFISGLAVGALFFVVERRIDNPLLNINAIISNHVLTSALIAQLLMYAGAFGLTFLFSLYLQIIKELSPQSAGQILMVSPVVMAVFAPVCGRLADSYPPGHLTLTGMFSIFFSLLFASQIAPDTGLTMILAVLFFQGAGFALFSSPNMTTIMSCVNRKEYGLASALSAETRSLGMVVSMMVITVFMALYVGENMVNTHGAELLSVMRASILMFAGFVFCGIVLLLSRRFTSSANAD